ncbi:putative plasma membrane proteolipid 3 [Triangularia setosa]|uniref:Plasma membrane proteolipid 3 n=1 Tax=Triangularia setosa TaxID=2587417 RepID=A0AAN6W214_9PEZI|nr:putative plasma membrane proteolipid 3 [Podospora setosa]
MEKSPAYNYNGGTTAGMDTGITGTSSAHNPVAQQAPAYSNTTTTANKNHNNDYYAPPSAGVASAPTTHPVGIGAGLDHTNRDSMASTAVAPTPAARSSRTSSFTGSDVLLLIMAIFLPPVAVFLKRGCDAHFFINILLTILAWLPGMIHAFYVVVRYPGDLGDRRMGKYEGKRGL